LKKGNCKACNVTGEMKDFKSRLDVLKAVGG